MVRAAPEHSQFPLRRIATSDARAPEWELWSFDHGTFERFVDSVEQHEEFAHLMLQCPRRTRVYWLEA